MFRARTLLLPVLSISPLLVSVAAPLACGSSAATATLLPITGITVRAETLTVGLGCGLANSQIFKYALVVFGRNPSATNTFDVYVASNLYDCFSDGQFVDLPPSGGNTDYMLQVYAYNQANYLSVGDAKIRAAVANPATLPATNPTYTTTCSATEVGDVQALAVCQPLKVGPTGVGAPLPPATVTLAAGSFARGDSGTATCDGEYATVRYRATPSGGTAGAITDVRCSHVTIKGVEPVTISIAPAVAPASYLIEVALLRDDGSVLGQTTCTADTSPGLTSAAVCQPIP